MGDYSDLKRQQRYWESEASQLRSELKKWKRRKTDVVNVQSALRSNVKNGIADVNAKMNSTKEILDRAIECPTKEGLMNSIFSSVKREPSLDGDSNLSQVKEALSREEGNCIRKITDLDNEIQRAENKISQIKRAIRNLDKD